MSKQSGKRHRYEVMHGEDADDFVANQRDAGKGHWQTVSSWMIPSVDYR